MLARKLGLSNNASSSVMFATGIIAATPVEVDAVVASVEGAGSVGIVWRVLRKGG